MKGILIVAVGAAAGMAAVYFSRPSGALPEGYHAPGGGELAADPGLDAASSLRDQLLHASPQALGIAPVRGVWGVLMERGYAKGVATVVALVDGTASLYISTGGSAVGGRAHERARLAAVKLCAAAADHLAETTVAREYPPPTAAHVRFYVLTDAGVRSVETDWPAARGDGGPQALASLLEQGQAVIDALREATERGIVR
jgi:hypothetical protein